MKGFVGEFKEFLLKGNVMDMAVGFMFGAAFATVVKSLVNNVVMPPIGLLMGKVDFSQLFVNLGSGNFDTLKAAEEAGAPVIKYGVFINDVISFVILGLVIFLMVKAVNRMKREEPKEEEEPKKSDEVLILEEIRDVLRQS